MKNNLTSEDFKMAMELNKVEDLRLIFPIINGKVSMAINRMIYRNFRKRGLQITPEQWTVLAFLWQEDGVSQQMLCDSTYKDKPSMTHLIDNLEKQELVYRLPSKEDRRSKFIHLTELGRSIEEPAAEAVYETMTAALQGIDEEGMERLKNVLALVFGNVSKALEKNE